MSTEIEKVEKQSLERFNFLKETSAELVKRLSAINVTDDTTEAIATQQLSGGKNFISEIESLRVIIKKPYLETGKKIDEAAKSLASPVDEQMKLLGNKLLAWKQKKFQEQQKKLRELEEIKKEIIKYQNETIVEINNCNTSSELSKVFLKRIGKDDTAFPGKDVWGDAMPDAQVMLGIIKKHGKLRLEQIKALANTPVEKIEEVKTQQEAQTAQVMVEDQEVKTTVADKNLAVLNTTKTTGIRKDWNFEIVDKDLVPRNYLIVDEAAVRELMRDMVKAGTLKDGEEFTMNGIRFSQKESLIVRK